MYDVVLCLFLGFWLFGGGGVKLSQWFPNPMLVTWSELAQLGWGFLIMSFNNLFLYFLPYFRYWWWTNNDWSKGFAISSPLTYFAVPVSVLWVGLQNSR
jgi:hypothetical protein